MKHVNHDRDMNKRWLVGVFCGAWWCLAHAAAGATLDCPLRDAPFSVDSPLIDLLLSERAKTVINRHSAGGIARIDPFVAVTRAPSFGAILTFRKVLAFPGAAPVADVPKLDAELRALPVTAADRQARCERYDDTRPQFKLPTGNPRVLLFGKITGFRDAPSVESAAAAFTEMARHKGWALVVANQGGAMHPAVLRNFDVVIWNNISGDVLTTTQRRAFRAFVERGGGVVAVHGSAGDPAYFWDWYADTLVGARFTGHPTQPQFQDAQIRLESNATGIGAGIAPSWTMNDEWYSFEKSARAGGAIVIATLDEASYSPGRNAFSGAALSMGADHPIAWARCVGKGRAFYSAIGHRPETYADANHILMLEQGVAWAAGHGRGAHTACELRRN